jgi:hypothetical protein
MTSFSVRKTPTKEEVMLSAYFDPGGRRIRALRDGPAGALFDGFARALSEMGYATITARRYLRAAEHFIHWTDRNRLPVQQVNEESLAQFRRCSRIRIRWQ